MDGEGSATRVEFIEPPFDLDSLIDERDELINDLEKITAERDNLLRQRL